MLVLSSNSSQHDYMANDQHDFMAKDIIIVSLVLSFLTVEKVIHVLTLLASFTCFRLSLKWT